MLVVPTGRLGLELTDIFSVGATNQRGSLYLQFERRWRDIRAVIRDQAMVIAPGRRQVVRPQS